MPTKKTKIATTIAPVAVDLPVEAPVAAPVGLRVALSDASFATSFRTWFPNAVVLKNPEDAKNYDLIVFPGGADVEPKHYNAQDEGMCWTDPARDVFELAVFKVAEKHQIKMFGSCRGLQIINVGRGGTLYQDLGTNGRRHSGSHKLDRATMDHGTKLMSLLPEHVNSMHHQGIQRLGEGLVTLAVHNSVPEIIVGKTVLATQFHPELMPKDVIAGFFEMVKDWASISLKTA